VIVTERDRTRQTERERGLENEIDKQRIKFKSDRHRDREIQ